MEQAITYVGLDVHKDMIAVAIAETGRLGEVRVTRSTVPASASRGAAV